MNEVANMLIYEAPEWDLERILSVSIALVLLILILVLYHRHLKKEADLANDKIDLTGIYGHKKEVIEALNSDDQD